MKIVIALNTTFNLVNFRSGLICALVDAGHEVVAVAPPDEYVPQLTRLGCRYLPIPMYNKSPHLGKDLLLLFRFCRLLWLERPDVLLSYTVKPNVFGSIAAHMLQIPVVNNITGLGSVFISENWLTRLVKVMYRLALSRSTKVFFQNNDDRCLFIDDRLVRAELTDLLPGSGVDLDRFKVQSLRSKEGDSNRFRFLLIARMLLDKGIEEYVKAAKILKRSFPVVECCLLGSFYVENPTAISCAQMDKWVTEGIVKYLGTSDDVRKQIADSDCVVLPSYREGTPRTLLEAAAMGRPIVTTDSVGCREVVDDGVNGYLCKARDAVDLAEKMAQMIRLSSNERQKMGLHGRKKMELEFDERIIIERYLQVIEEIGRT